MMRKKDTDWWFVALIVCAVGLTLLAGAVVRFYFHKFDGKISGDQDVWGQFGDYIGGTLNPIISLIAFFALLYTIKIQSQELKSSTQQLSESAGALKLQSALWKKQNFESTFFLLLSNHRALIEDCRVRKPSNQNIFTGMGAINSYYSEYRPPVIKNENLEAFSFRVGCFFDGDYEGVTLQGFNEVVADSGFIFMFINGASIGHDDKQFYANLFWNNLKLNEKYILVLYLFYVPRSVYVNLHGALVKYNLLTPLFTSQLGRGMEELLIELNGERLIDE